MNRTILHFIIGLLLLTAGVARAAEETNSDPFQIIVQRNIFDPTRSGRAPRSSRRVERPRVESFVLLGVLENAGQWVAFLDGFGTDPSRGMKAGDFINGYKIAQVTFNGIKLTGADGKTFALLMGSYMRRENGGPWALSDHGEITEAPSATAAPKTTETTTSADSDEPAPSSAAAAALERLKKRRMEEDK